LLRVLVPEVGVYCKVVTSEYSIYRCPSILGHHNEDIFDIDFSEQS